MFTNPLGLVSDTANLIKDSLRGSKVTNAPKTYVINKKNHVLAELFKGKDVKAVSALLTNFNRQILNALLMFRNLQKI